MPHASDYQRFRLWSGIFSIGCNLGLIWAFAAFFTLANPQILAFLPVWLWLLAPVAAFLAFGFVFDLLSGHIAERAFGRSRQEFSEWKTDWLQTAPRAAFGLLLALSIFAFFANTSPAIRGFVASLVPALTFVLLVVLPSRLPARWKIQNEELRAFEARLRPELDAQGVAPWPVVWIEGEDETLNGAVPPGARQIWLSHEVARTLSPREAALLVARDFWFVRSGKAARGFSICALWLSIGAFLALFLPPQSSPLAFATTAAAISTTWCFAALFVWPRLNQKWMREADRFLLERASVDELAALFEKVQTLNASDTDLSDAKSGVFHPIPELSRRLENLK